MLGEDILLNLYDAVQCTYREHAKLASLLIYIASCLESERVYLSKVIICKSCGELSLLVQFTTCTFEPAFRFVISKQKYNKKYKKILNSQLLTWPKPAKTNKNQSNSQILFHKKSSQQDFVKGTLYPTALFYVEINKTVGSCSNDYSCCIIDSAMICAFLSLLSQITLAFFGIF